MKACSSRGDAPNNKAEVSVARKKINRKEEQLSEAVAWCIENNVGDIRH